MKFSPTRILITGGAGFLGSHLCDTLLKKGNEIICVDNCYTGSKSNIYHLMGNPRFEFLRHDVTFPLYAEIDEIYNLACPASPIHYQQDPVQTTKTSVHGAINMLGLAKRTGAKIFQASTSEVYGTPEVHPQAESYWGNVNPIGKRSCYDEGKRCAETLFFDYRRQHNLSIKVARIFNTYGPRMHPDDGRVVSNFIMQALQNLPITVYGDGSQTRSFCYVDDMIHAFIKMMASDDAITGPVNLGNPHEITILELAETIVSITDSKSEIIFQPLPSDDPIQRKPDITMASTILDWTPKVPLKRGLEKTINYFDFFLSTDSNQTAKHPHKTKNTNIKSTHQKHKIKDLIQKIETLSSRYIYASDLEKGSFPFDEVLIFGASKRGRLMKEFFEENQISVRAFIDNQSIKHATLFCNLQTHELSDALRQYPETPIFIASAHYNTIASQLISHGVSTFYAMPMSSFYYYPLLLKKYAKPIETVYNMLHDDISKNIFASIIKSYLTGDDGYLQLSPYGQYFHPQVSPQDGDIIIDGGAYTGDTANAFMAHAQCRHIISFEPSSNSFNALLENTSNSSSQVTCINKGLWSKSTTLSFAQFEDSPVGNHIAEYGETNIQTTSIDQIVSELYLPKIDLIKLDIEGGEMEALIGAQQSIKKFRPKLQISLYHNMNDLWELPLFINKLRLNYKFFIGHHSHDAHETIFYCYSNQ